MNIADFYRECGFLEEDLQKGDYETVEELKWFFLQVHSLRKMEALKYLAKINCYLAVQCCSDYEEEQAILQMIRGEIAAPTQSFNKPCNVVLTLYYLKEYDTAKQYLNRCFQKRDDKYVLAFYEDILSIGFSSVKDQIYFLCQAYSSLYFFSTLSGLAHEYNWHCKVDLDDSYGPEFQKMIVNLFRLKEYKVLQDLLYVLGDNKKEAKEIIEQCLKSANIIEMRQYMRAQRLQNVSLSEEHILFEIALAESSQDFDNLFAYVEKSSKKSFSSYFWFKFQIAANKYCTIGQADLLIKFLTNKRFSAQEFFQDIGKDYFSILQMILEYILRNPASEIKVLKLLSSAEGVNFYAEELNVPERYMSALEKEKEIYEERWSDGFFRSKIKGLLPKLQLLEQEDIAYFYKNTFLKSKYLFEGDTLYVASSEPLEIREETTEETIEEIIEEIIEEEVTSVEKREQEQIITLTYGEESEYSFRYVLEGEEFIAYQIPAGVYGVTNLSFEKDGAFILCRFADVETREIPEDEIMVRYVTRKMPDSLTIEDDEYIVLTKNGRFSFFIKSSKT